MNRKITIAIYHYVRDLKHSRYPEIKGLSTSDFLRQIDYMQKNYTIVSAEQMIAAVENKEEIPPKALWLTFDDGYLDHYTQVFPILDERKIQGSFFIPAMAILEGKILSVNKIHAILGSVADKQELVSAIFSMLDENRRRYSLKPNQEYYQETVLNNRFDNHEVNFIKNMLQKDLPQDLREKILNELFKKYVSADEKSFAKELYMDLAQIRCLKRHGMFIGGHGYEHVWMDTLEPVAQENEIRRSLDFLNQVGCDLRRWVMCYPYGAYNDSLLAILKKQNCKIGLSCEVGVADLSENHALALPRIATNDLPK